MSVVSGNIQNDYPASRLTRSSMASEKILYETPREKLSDDLPVAAVGFMHPVLARTKQALAALASPAETFDDVHGVPQRKSLSIRKRRSEMQVSSETTEPEVTFTEQKMLNHFVPLLADVQTKGEAEVEGTTIAQCGDALIEKNHGKAQEAAPRGKSVVEESLIECNELVPGGEPAISGSQIRGKDTALGHKPHFGAVDIVPESEPKVEVDLVSHADAELEERESGSEGDAEVDGSKVVTGNKTEDVGDVHEPVVRKSNSFNQLPEGTENVEDLPRKTLDHAFNASRELNADDDAMDAVAESSDSSWIDDVAESLESPSGKSIEEERGPELEQELVFGEKFDMMSFGQEY